MKAACVAVFLCGAFAFGQSVTGKVEAHGSCNIVNSGHNATISLTSCGISQKQGEKIIQMLKDVLALQDQAKIDDKLNQLLDLASRPTQIQNCTGSNCVQTGTQTNYGAPQPPPKILILRNVHLGPGASGGGPDGGTDWEL